MALKNLNIIDKCTIAYHCLIALIILFFSYRIPLWQYKILINISIIAIIALLISRISEKSPAFIKLIKNFYPLLLTMPAYMQTGLINRVIFKDYLDPFFEKLEYAVFGFQPAIAFANAFPQAWFSELMHTAYFSYYAIIPGLAVLLYVKSDRTRFQDYMFSACNGFYICYVIYVLLPVEGAIYFNMNNLPGNGPFTSIMQIIYKHFETGGAAFPSSHVALTLISVYYCFKYVRGLFIVYLLIFIFLSLSTVYCRYHYAIDVIAGIITGILLLFLLRRINPELRRVENRS